MPRPGSSDHDWLFASRTPEGFAPVLGSVDIGVQPAHSQRSQSLSSCPTLNLCIPEDSQGTGNAFGLGEGMQAPDRHRLRPTSPAVTLTPFPAHPAHQFPQWLQSLLLHLASSISSERPPRRSRSQPPVQVLSASPRFAVKLRQPASPVCSVSLVDCQLHESRNGRRACATEPGT